MQNGKHVVNHNILDCRQQLGDKWYRTTKRAPVFAGPHLAEHTQQSTHWTRRQGGLKAQQEMTKDNDEDGDCKDDQDDDDADDDDDDDPDATATSQTSLPTVRHWLDTTM